MKQPMKRGPQAFFLLVNAIRLFEAANFDDGHTGVIIRQRMRAYRASIVS